VVYHGGTGEKLKGSLGFVIDPTLTSSRPKLQICSFEFYEGLWKWKWGTFIKLDYKMII
jgi:hypothetical protein